MGLNSEAVTVAGMENGGTREMPRTREKRAVLAAASREPVTLTQPPRPGSTEPELSDAMQTCQLLWDGGAG